MRETMNTYNRQLRSNLHRNLFHTFRYFFWKMQMGSCGEGVFFENNVKILRYPRNVSIDDDAVLKEGCRICSCNEQAKISIGKRTTIGYHTFIFASERITIGSDCLIAPFVYIVDSNHGINRSMKINEQPNICAQVIIKNDVWIGTGATILCGVTIGEGAVIAAGSVVNQNVDDFQIVGGIPAKKIGLR